MRKYFFIFETPLLWRKTAQQEGITVSKESNMRLKMGVLKFLTTLLNHN